MSELLDIGVFEVFLLEEEKSLLTIKKYVSDVKQFLAYVGGNEIEKIMVIKYKEELVGKYEASSVNSKLAAVNKYLEFLGKGSIKVKPLKIQKQIFLSAEKELTMKEYQKLLETAKNKGDKRLELIMQTICATGIRVSELEYLTREAINIGKMKVSCKGKNRIVFLPKELCKQLKKYCVKKKIDGGSVFSTKTGKSLDRSNIWKMMKSLCKQSGVEESKVFPHNLRHLFARSYYKIKKDISKLADILGHSNINTTRIYTMESGVVHARQIERMNFFVLGYKETT